MNNQAAGKESKPEQTAPMTNIQAHVWPSWLALALVPVFLIVADLVAEAMMSAHRWSTIVANAIMLPVVLVPLIAAIVLASRAVRAGARTARRPRNIAVALTAIWAVLYVVAIWP